MTESSVEWFHRLAEVPGAGYHGEPSVDRRKLRGHDAIPKGETHTFQGKRVRSLWWPQKGGGSSASPVQVAAGRPAPDASIAAVRRRLAEVLELPGQASDYHFAIQGCVQEFWRRRRDEPDVLPHLEELCWINIRLLEARPDAVTNDQATGPRFYHVVAFGCLIQLYEREGALREALAVAERATRFEQEEDRLERIRQRLASVEAEQETPV